MGVVISDTVNGVLASLGLGGAGSTSQAPHSNQTFPPPPISSEPEPVPSSPTDILVDILVDTGVLMDTILDLRVRGNDLVSACGCSPGHDSRFASIVGGINTVLHASLGLTNTSDLSLGLGALSGSLLHLDDELGLHTTTDLQNILAKLSVSVRAALGSVAKVRVGLRQCQCSRNGTLLAGLRLAVGNHRHALLDVAL